jgi:hypothetical protein
MFDRVGDLAERVATNVSRRAFLGRLGEGALGLAAVIGGVLAFPASARADRKSCWVCGLGPTYKVCTDKPGPTCAFLHYGCGGC